MLLLEFALALALTFKFEFTLGIAVVLLATASVAFFFFFVFFALVFGAPRFAFETMVLLLFSKLRSSMHDSVLE